MEEIWKDIEGFEGIYKISNLGRVESFPRSRRFGRAEFKTKQMLLKPHKHITGYLRVSLNKRHYYIHKLVGNAFIKNPENKPCINHKDGNKHNNNINNLEWVSYSQNNKHAFDIGLKKPTQGIRHSSSKLSEEQVLEIRKKYIKGINQYIKGNSEELSILYGVSQETIGSICSKKTWKSLV